MAKHFKESCAFRTSIGGQALMEGILMRGPKKQAIVCRTKDGLVEKVDQMEPWRNLYPVFSVPFIRGIPVFLESLVMGMKALTYSASLLPEEEQGEPDKLDQWIEAHFSEEKAQKLIIGVAVVLGLALSIGLFVFLPALIVRLINFHKSFSMPLVNLLEGIFRVGILLAYMALVSKVKDIKRVFSYHGAEHKTIFCYEHGLPLTVENVHKESRFHPRCGTSFLLVVVLVSILVNLLFNFIFPMSNVFARIGCHILLIPVVVGISYEINRWCGGHDNWLSAMLSAPGKWLQHITTNEPEDGMIECAIRALELVIPEEKGSDAWGS